MLPPGWNKDSWCRLQGTQMGYISRSGMSSSAQTQRQAGQKNATPWASFRNAGCLSSTVMPPRATSARECSSVNALARTIARSARRRGSKAATHLLQAVARSFVGLLADSDNLGKYRHDGYLAAVIIVNQRDDLLAGGVNLDGDCFAGAGLEQSHAGVSKRVSERSRGFHCRRSKYIGSHGAGSDALHICLKLHPPYSSQAWSKA